MLSSGIASQDERSDSMVCPISQLVSCPASFWLVKILILAWVIFVPILIVERLDKIIKLLEKK